LAKDLEDSDWVLPAPEERIDTVFEAKFAPSQPMHVLGLDPLKSNPGCELLINSMVVSAERMGLRSWHSVHGSACGKVDSKWARRAQLVSSHDRVVTSTIRLTPTGM
jgi:hypothetical protein